MFDVLATKYASWASNKELRCKIRVLARSACLLLQDDLRRALGEDHVAITLRPLDHRAHGFAGRVKGVNFVEPLFRVLLADRLVTAAHLGDKAEQSALGLVPDLSREAALVFWRLRRRRRRLKNQTLILFFCTSYTVMRYHRSYISKP